MSNVKCQMSNVNKGFTLIEIIVVFSTIAFLSTVGIVSYTKYNETQTLAVATQELTTAIQLAKSRAFSQVKPPTICINQQLDGYSLTIATSLLYNTYTLNVVCEENDIPLKPYDSVTLPSNITFGQQFTDGANTARIFFPVLSREVQGAGIIVLSGYGQKRWIAVDSIGKMTIDKAQPTPTPTVTLTPTPLPTATPLPTYTPTPTPFNFPTPTPVCSGVGFSCSTSSECCSGLCQLDVYKYVCG